MARSWKQNQVSGNTMCESEKRDKQIANRKLRKYSKQTLEQMTADDFEDYVTPEIDDVSDPWTFAKDGKHYMKDETIEKNPGYMRK